jgi:hypothetical protein
LTAVRELRQEKIQKNFICPDLEEDSHYKMPAVARINVSRQSFYQPTGGRERLEDRDYESKEESSDKPAKVMEISLDITDEPKFTITEVYNMIDSQQPDESKTVAGKKVTCYKEWLLHKLYNGGLFNPHKLFNRDQYAIAVHANTIFIYVPT